MTRKVKPFLPQEKGYTIVDNVVFDYILPELTANGWKVLCFIIRKTKGWQKEWDGLSYSQIMKGTGIKSSATISKVLTELLDGNYIWQVKADDQFTAARYALNTALEIEVANGTASEIEVDTASENEAMPTSESKDTKQNMKQRGNKKEGATPARDYLTDVFNGTTNGLQSGIADPSQDIEAYMQTADDFIATYRKRTGLWPDTNVQKPAIKELARDGANLDLWDKVVTAWVKIGWNKRNVEGMIDCYERGEIPTTRKNGGKHARPKGTGLDEQSQAISDAIKARARSGSR